jgi:hypothetical protein
MEIWKDLKGLEGIYQVSNLGNVRSLDRLEKFRNGLRVRKGKLMKCSPNNGYLSVNLKNNGWVKHAFVHRLVAEAFIDSFTPDCVVNHVDFDRCNNTPENLTCGTQMDNIIHNMNNDKHLYGERNGAAKLNEDQVRKLKDAITGISQMAKSFGVTYQTAKRIRRGEAWTRLN